MAKLFEEKKSLTATEQVAQADRAKEEARRASIKAAQDKLAKWGDNWLVRSV